MLIDYLKPKDINGFTRKRLGSESDGGYVVPGELVESTGKCISFGVGGDISFEIDLHKVNRDVKVWLYDHTVADLPSENVPESFVFERKMVSAISSENSIDVKTAVGRASGSGLTLLKCDIEGSEYDIFGDCSCLSPVDIFIMEIHGLGTRRQDAASLLKSISERFELFHVHGNNCGTKFVDAESNLVVPDVLELTYVNRRLVKSSSVPAVHFPVSGIDFPNSRSTNDFDLPFANGSA